MNINDDTLIAELCIYQLDAIKSEEKKANNGDPFEHPLDDDVVGKDGLLNKLLPGEPGERKSLISYSKAGDLDRLWRALLEKAICCLRRFDEREPFLKSPQKQIVAYGIDALTEYHRKYTEFESLLYGASAYYRDHVFHVIRVWMLGVVFLIKPINEKEPFYQKIELDGGAKQGKDKTIGFFELISMWTIAALCHDLGYPLEKADQILAKTQKMMKEFIPNPNVWSNFNFLGSQDNINEYILKFISTKMKKIPGNEGQGQGSTEGEEYHGRIQPKYYLKYAKSLEGFQHGIISTIIVYKMLLYFLESDFNLNDDYVYSPEDARQFYIRREILRAMASHTCPDAYNIHINTFPSLLFICDELQEWGRKTWNELYTGLHEEAVRLTIEDFSKEGIDYIEDIDMKSVKDESIIVDNICRVFERQYSLYKTTFRDGQDTAKRDFDLKKTMNIILNERGTDGRKITVEYGLPHDTKSYFRVNLEKAGNNTKKTSIHRELDEKLRDKLYYKDVEILQ